MLVTSQFYMVNSHKQSLINAIQQDDPSYDPLALALAKTPFIGVDLFSAACDRVYIDGYYGPVSAEDWKETDGRKPYTVKEALNIIARVLANVENVWEVRYCEDLMEEFPQEFENWTPCKECKGHKTDMIAQAEEIRAEIVYWYRDIYGVGYPHV